jgi:putative ABC transport system permease protein
MKKTGRRKRALKPRWRKVLADLWAGKSRTLLVVASIAVGVFAVGGIVSGYAIIDQDIDASYASVNPANVEIWTDPFDDDTIQSIERIPGIAHVEGRRMLGVRASQDGKAWLSFDLFAVPDLKASQINRLETIEGDSIPGDRQLLIEYHPMHDPGFQVGDLIQVQLSDGTTRTMPVAGIVRDQAGGSDPEQMMGGFRGYITQETVEWLGAGQPTDYDRLYATVNGDSDDERLIQGVADAIEDKMERSGRQVYHTQTSKTHEHPMVDMALAIMGVLGALGGLVILLGGSLIVNTLNALLAQHLRQIGVMKLIGARSTQILGMYLLLILAYGIIALAIAVPLGALGGYGLALLIAYYMNANLQGFRFIPMAILVQTLIALFVPLAAGFVPVNSGAKTTVRRAISSDRPGGGGQASTAAGGNQLGAWIRWLSRPILLSIRNTFRRKGRLLLTLFTLTVGGAIFVGVFNVRASMERYMAQLGQHFMADVTLSLGQPYRVSEVEWSASQVPGVRAVEAWSGAGAEILDAEDNVVANLQIIAPPADTALLEPDMLAGRWIIPGDEKVLAISDAIWDLYPDLQPGDTLRLSVQGRRAEGWTIVGVFRFTNMLGDPMAYADYDYISRFLRTPDRSASYRVITGAHSLEEQLHVSEVLDRQLRAHGFRVSDVEAGLVTQKQTKQAVVMLVTFLLVMALLTAFVGSIGLMGTMGMNVMERTREIGVMRAIGAVDLQVMQSVLVEGVVIGMISWCLAWLLSYPISYLLLMIISEAMISAPIPLAFTLEGVAIWLVVVLALSALASILPARNAARLTIREVLAYE